jgi:copper homeostasis protein
MEGLSEIRRTVEQAAGRIEVLPGGGVREPDLERLVRETGVSQVHLYLTRLAADSSAAGNPAICFAAAPPTGETEYRAVDGAAVRGVRVRLDEISRRAP